MRARGFLGSDDGSQANRTLSENRHARARDRRQRVFTSIRSSTNQMRDGWRLDMSLVDVTKHVIRVVSLRAAVTAEEPRARVPERSHDRSVLDPWGGASTSLPTKSPNLGPHSAWRLG